MKFSDDVQFLHTFHLKSTINANIVYVPLESKFSTSVMMMKLPILPCAEKLES